MISAGSSKGRTPDSGSGNWGSSPWPAIYEGEWAKAKCEGVKERINAIEVLMRARDASNVEERVEFPPIAPEREMNWPVVQWQDSGL